MIDGEIRFRLGTALMVVAWVAAFALLAVGCWLEVWRMAACAVMSAIVAGTLTIHRDNEKTRRVVRAVARETCQADLKSVR